MEQGKKTLKRNVVPTFEDLKKPVVESKRKPPAARKSLFEEIGELSQEQMNNKTQEVSEVFCVNCHNCKEVIGKLLKQKTEQKISIDKPEEIINKMQTKINNPHCENIKFFDGENNKKPKSYPQDVEGTLMQI